MDNKSKIHQFSLKFFLYFFIVLFLFILADIIFFSDNLSYYTKKELIIENKFIILIAILICLLLTFIKLRFGFFRKFSANYLLFIIDASIVLLIIQLFVVYQIYFFPGWDPGGIRRTINDLIYNNKEILINEISYPFSRLPNNLSMTAILIIITRVCDYLNLSSYLGWLIGSIFSVNFAGIFTFLSTYVITQNFNYSVFSWVFFSLLVGLSPWISIPYTDTYSISLPILTFFLYITEDPTKKNILRWFLIGFFGILGYLIKPTAIIALIAIIILEILKIGNHGKTKKNISFQKFLPFLFIILSIIPTILIYKYFRVVTNLDIEQDQKFGVLHYVMMGLNPETHGVYSDKDVELSASFTTLEERNKANFSEIKQRFSDFGIIGYIAFLGKKALVNFSDGTFAWNVEGNFIYQRLMKNNAFAVLLRNIYYPDGKFYNLYSTILQVLWFVVLFLLLGLVFHLKNPDEKSLGVVLTLLGITIFVMIFEARARYLYSYTPFFMIGAGIGLQKLRENRENLKELFNLTKIKSLLSLDR
jgi:hypothetical protein